MKLNPLGKRCDKKMTANGLVACTAPKCRRKATIGAFGRDQFLTSFLCDNPDHHGGVKRIVERNEQGYIAYTANLRFSGLTGLLINKKVAIVTGKGDKSNEVSTAASSPQRSL
jgi:hypothetical protein